VRLAARGARDLDGGVERVIEHTERAALRRQARRVLVQSLVLGLGVALATLAVRVLRDRPG
jgi:hypothetical protein